ncbi:MAG: molybdopterin biosynthesis protein [Desulfohalobiaceae bacterium]|nr:molybdopterin biosynthesis protein [Desulfohalobiaceae bacterium]
MSQRNIYLETVPIPEALTRVKSRLDRDCLLQRELIPAEEAAGRITAEPIFARYSSPTHHSAAMDGIALAAESTFGAREGRPLALRRNTGYIPVNTGDPLPSGCDAVVMIEYVEQLDQETVQLEHPAFPWQHVRRIGEDIVATELLLPQNHRLTAYDIGALLSGGIYEVPVRQRPRVHIVPTGDEILDFTRRPNPEPGQVIESNSQVLASLARSWGCTAARVPPVPDDEDKLAQALQEALDSGAHIVVIGAGSSAGSRDFTRRVLERFGTVLVHGIKAMPGKPTLVAVSGNRLLIGAPGYPVSAVICFEEILRPLVEWMTRCDKDRGPEAEVRLTRKVPSKLGQEEFLRLCVGQVGEELVGTPLPRGAGLITSLTRAQGMARIPAESEGKQAGEFLRTELLVPRQELERVLVCVGSHDNTIDLLANELMGLESPLTLTSTNVGSMGGLQAIRDGSAHLAGTHLFDPQSGEYNFPFLDRIIGDMPVTAVNLAIRHQGLLVAKGNPLGIRGIEDLTREEVRFVNRQRGAGTRILLDDALNRHGISGQSIQGYDREEFTHMAVAVNVKSGVADCGMGIHAAAKALDLDFVPFARERYDLVIPRAFHEEPKIQTLLGLIRQPDLQTKIRDLGGYETPWTGRIVRPGDGLPPEEDRESGG